MGRPYLSRRDEFPVLLVRADLFTNLANDELALRKLANPIFLIGCSGGMHPIMMTRHCSTLAHKVVRLASYRASGVWRLADLIEMVFRIDMIIVTSDRAMRAHSPTFLCSGIFSFQITRTGKRT